jgi:ribosomal protein S18 acetylase RimI-like enzyme
VTAKQEARGVEVRRPAECGERALAGFVQLAGRGGPVVPVGLAGRVQSAHWLAFHYEGGRLAAIAALKAPRTAYRDRVFRQAGVSDLAPRFSAELGWVCTGEAFRRRGIARAVVSRLLEGEPAADVFATARVNNLPMARLLEQFGFVPTGTSFVGRHGKEPIRLWLRPAPADSTP